MSDVCKMVALKVLLEQFRDDRFSEMGDQFSQIQADVESGKFPETLNESTLDAVVLIANKFAQDADARKWEMTHPQGTKKPHKTFSGLNQHRTAYMAALE